MTTEITCERCRRTTTDPDRWDPEFGTGRIFCDPCWPHRNEETTMTTYKIVRFHQDLDTPNETLVRGLTLEQAQAHCQRDDTHGDGWFDGYTEEDKGTWDTGEVRLWLANDEPLYRMALTCGSADEMRATFDRRIAGAHVDWNAVDWDDIYASFEEDESTSRSAPTCSTPSSPRSTPAAAPAERRTHGASASAEHSQPPTMSDEPHVRRIAEAELDAMYRSFRDRRGYRQLRLAPRIGTPRSAAP
jgi:hypothetical protein